MSVYLFNVFEINPKTNKDKKRFDKLQPQNMHFNNFFIQFIMVFRQLK